VRYDATVVSKRYDQYCPVCHALGLVGERWALLVVRELLHGPKRYTDLLEGMPGIGTNILAARLRELEGAGVVQKRKLPPPAASTVYELTDYGRQLEEPLYALARWGARTLGPPGKGDELAQDWGLDAFAALLDREAARGVTQTYVMRLPDETYSVQLVDGRLHVSAEPVEDPDLEAELSMETLYALASGRLDPREAVDEGLVRLTVGNPEALERFFSIFSFAPREPLTV
jgi:DNA-binding HxlR family transcriptional regulator